MLTQEPSGVHSLTLAGPLIDTARWIEDTKVLRLRLPEDAQTALAGGEQSGDRSSADYLAATAVYNTRFLARSGWPLAAVPECKDAGGFNIDIYQTMWGPTEFSATGTLIDFDRTDRLNELRLPVLFIVGRHDEARPETMLEYQHLVAGSVVEIIEGAAHISMVDQPRGFNRAVDRFLDSNAAK